LWIEGGGRERELNHLNHIEKMALEMAAAEAHRGRLGKRCWRLHFSLKGNREPWEVSEKRKDRSDLGIRKIFIGNLLSFHPFNLLFSDWSNSSWFFFLVF
jgi:hypothetical protein